MQRADLLSLAAKGLAALALATALAPLAHAADLPAALTDFLPSHL